MGISLESWGGIHSLLLTVNSVRMQKWAYGLKKVCNYSVVILCLLHFSCYLAVVVLTVSLSSACVCDNEEMP